MIVAAAVLAAAVVTSDPERDALLARWKAASPKAVAANRLPVTQSMPSQSVVSSMRALAAAELGVPGRYRLGAVAPLVKNPTWWQRLWAWLHDRWNDFVRAFFSRVRVSQRTTLLIADTVLALFALGALYGLVTLVRTVVASRSRKIIESHPLPEAADAQTLYLRACRCAEAGDYGGAARWLFRALLALFDVRGDLRDDASATVGDVRAALRKRDALATSVFDAIAAPFVRAAYAERPVEAAQWERARDAYESLVRSAPA